MTIRAIVVVLGLALVANASVEDESFCKTYKRGKLPTYDPSRQIWEQAFEINGTFDRPEAISLRDSTAVEAPAGCASFAHLLSAGHSLIHSWLCMQMHTRWPVWSCPFRLATPPLPTFASHCRRQRPRARLKSTKGRSW